MSEAVNKPSIYQTRAEVRICKITIVLYTCITTATLCYSALITTFTRIHDIYSYVISITCTCFPTTFTLLCVVIELLLPLLLCKIFNCCSIGDPALAVNGGGNGLVSAEWLIPKAMYLKENESEVYNSSRWIVECQDYLNYKLCGRMVASQNNAITR